MKCEIVVINPINGKSDLLVKYKYGNVFVKINNKMSFALVFRIV